MSDGSSEFEPDSYSSGSSSSESTDNSEVDKIIGINIPELDTSNPNLKFFVKLKDKAYKYCDWMSSSSISNLNPRKVKVFEEKCSFGLFPVDFIENLYKPTRVDFEKEFLIPQKILAKQKIKNEGKKYLVLWGKLQIKDATWESDPPQELIDQYKKILSTTHVPPIYQHKLDSSIQFTNNTMLFSNNNQLKNYQYVGVQWLFDKWKIQKGGILADEMGMGKTIQALALMQTLKFFFKVKGPFLVICPLSTAFNWQKECNAWTNLNSIVYTGNDESRNTIKNFCIFNEKSKDKKMKVELIIVPYDNAIRDISFFQKFRFAVQFIDEAHRLKSYHSKTYQALSKIPTHCSFLLTGTPIQNDLEELISLLHFIDPTAFSNIEELASKYNTSDFDQMKELSSLLENYILRRKKDTFEKSIKPKEEIVINVELTHEQRLIYKLLLDDHRDELLQTLGTSSLTSFKNISMELRKICNHPFLTHETLVKEQYKQRKGINREMTEQEDMESLVGVSGKMILLDKLLPKLKEGGHKVLIFSQMTKVLDIIQRFLDWRNFHYERLDGSVSVERRSESIERFTTFDDSFVFLLSTRAGGQGINLTVADTVIIYDSDWNPQNDIQAMARCHRIGQDKEVKVYRLITKNSYEEEMFERASMKLGLDKVITDGFDDSNLNAEQMDMMLRKGAYYILKDQDDDAIDKFCAEDIDQILLRRTKTVVDHATDSKLSKISFDTNENEVDFGADNFWSQFFTSSADTPLGKRRNRPVNVYAPAEKLMKKKEFKVVFPQIKDSGLISAIASVDNGNDKDFNYKAVSIIYYLCNTEEEFSDDEDLQSYKKKNSEKPKFDMSRFDIYKTFYRKIIKNINCSKTIDENIPDYLPFSDQLFMYSYFKNDPDFDKLVNSIYLIDMTRLVVCYSNYLIDNGLFNFGNSFQVEPQWTSCHDYVLLYQKMSKENIISMLDKITPQRAFNWPSNPVILHRQEILFFEIQCLIPKNFFTLQNPFSPKQFYDHMQVKHETMKENQVRRLMRAMYFFPIDNIKILIERYILLTKLSYRSEIIRRYVFMLFKKCNFELQDVDLTDISIAELNWIPKNAIESLSKQLKILRKLPELVSNIDVNMINLTPTLHGKFPSWWKPENTVSLFKYIAKNGFYSVTGLSVMTDFKGIFNGGSEKFQAHITNEATRMIPHFPENIKALSFLEKMDVWIGVIHCVVENAAKINSAGILKKYTPSINVNVVGVPNDDGVPIGYSATRCIKNSLYFLSIEEGPLFKIKFNGKVYSSPNLSECYCSLLLSLPEKEAEPLFDMSSITFFGLNAPIFVTMLQLSAMQSKEKKN